MRISDWSSDVCSSDLPVQRAELVARGIAQIGEIHFHAIALAHARRVFDRGAAGLDARRMPGVGLLRIRHRDTVGAAVRSEERRVGKECVSKCSSRRSPYHVKTNTNKTQSNKPT